MLLPLGPSLLPRHYVKKDAVLLLHSYQWTKEIPGRKSNHSRKRTYEEANTQTKPWFNGRPYRKRHVQTMCVIFTIHRVSCPSNESRQVRVHNVADGDSISNWALLWDLRRVYQCIMALTWTFPYLVSRVHSSYVNATYDNVCRPWGISLADQCQHE